MEISTIICTHNPDETRLRRTLHSLTSQTINPDFHEIILVDNASIPPLPLPEGVIPPRHHFKMVQEPIPGLSSARKRGLLEASADICVFVDDDNVLDPQYLDHAIRLFREHPGIGALGGKSLPEFERTPEAWKKPFFPLLALRDLGDIPKISKGLHHPESAINIYPEEAAPIGAGMAIRRRAGLDWVGETNFKSLTDRCGTQLSSAGDNDIVLSIMQKGWEVAYFPELVLTHLIPAARMESSYLKRLNRGIQKSWMQVLTKHNANPWPPIPGWSLPLRKIKAWFKTGAWKSEAASIEWHGIAGHFEGRTK